MQKLRGDHSTSEERSLRWGQWARSFQQGCSHSQCFQRRGQASPWGAVNWHSQSLPGPALVLVPEAPMSSTLSKNLWRCSSLSSWAFPKHSHCLAGGLIMKNPLWLHHAEPKKPCCYFCSIFVAPLLLEIHSPSPPPSPPLWHSLSLPVYPLPFSLHTTFVAIYLTKLSIVESFWEPSLLLRASPTLQLQILPCQRVFSLVRVFYWGQWANVSSGADIHSWTHCALFPKFQCLKAMSILLQNNS